MGFGNSHQKTGLNWPGRYKQRTGLGCRVSGVGADAVCEHAKWRRITGITNAVEGVLTAKERKAGLKRLVERIKAFTTENTETTEGNSKSETRNSKQTENGETERPGIGCRVSGFGNDDATELSLMTPFGRAVEEWVGAAGNSIESLCVELQISRARLTMLTKEYCGLTVQELVDGFKIRRVKRGLVERLREAAERLWGMPGSFVAWKTEGYIPQRHRGTENGKGSGFGMRKRSKYFRMRPEDYAAEERGDERARRIEELAAELRRDFDAEDWAARVGFASGARLKRACLNVLGRSLRALERALAAEVVRYYLCAEDKVLRQVACGDDSNPRVIRARWIYGKSEDPPTEPFLDEWSKAEAFARDWLERMRAGFG